MRDPFEEFLGELDACDLSRIRSCPVCDKFFVAWRKGSESVRPALCQSIQNPEVQRQADN